MTRAVFRGPKKGYTLSDKDVEWLARSMWGEEEADDVVGKTAVAWTHIRRFLLINYKWMSQGWPFWKYLQAHSQPINPQWLRTGKYCRPGGQYYGNPKHCSEASLKKRDKWQKGKVPAKWMKLAQAFSEGKVANPFYEVTYDFAADWLVDGQKRPGKPILMGKAPYNAHLTYSNLKPKEQKTVIPGDVFIAAPAGMVGLASGLILVGVGAFAIYLWRKYG